MGNKKAEKERRELNRRLLKKSFVSDIKDRRQVKLAYVRNFVAIFVGLLLANWITSWFGIDNEIIAIIISVVFVLLFQFLGELLFKREK